jgi:hypothetical protein
MKNLTGSVPTTHDRTMQHRQMSPEKYRFKYGSFKNAVGNAAHEACGLKAEKSSLPAMRNSTVRMVLKLAYPRALRLAA